MSARAALLASAVAAALSGCALGPDYRPPQAVVPSGWSASLPGVAAHADLAAWWRQFDDPVLDALMLRALERNADLRLAVARVREARAAVGVAGAALQPRLAADASVLRARISEVGRLPIPPGVPNPMTLYQYGFDAGWELDLFGGLRRGVEAAAAEFDAAREGERSALVTLAGEVARHYVELRALQQRIANTRASIDVAREALALAETRARAGLTSEVDALRFREAHAQLLAGLPPLEAALRATSFRLAVLAGEPPAALDDPLAAPRPLPVVAPALPLLLPADLLRQRPDLRRAEREVAAASARVGIATADLYPRVALAGGFGFEARSGALLGTAPSRFWRIGPSVHWPIFQGGRLRARLEAQDARLEQSLVRFERAVLDALEEVEAASVRYVRELERRRELATAIEANRLALELSALRYGRGLTDFLAVLDAQRQFHALRDQQIGSERDALLHLIALYKALGGGWPAPS